MTTAQQLRQLARDVETLCHSSPCMSVAGPVIDNATAHLCAIARIHEANAWDGKGK